jgi:hypothetical protein
MAKEMKGRVVSGEGKEAEIDGGYVKAANLKEDRIDRRFVRNQNDKRKVVAIIRDRGGNSVPAVCRALMSPLLPETWWGRLKILVMFAP